MVKHNFDILINFILFIINMELLFLFIILFFIIFYLYYNEDFENARSINNKRYQKYIFGLPY